MRTLLLFLISLAMTAMFAQPALVAQERGESHHFGMKSLDVFHDALHPLVHEAYENKDFATIRSGLADLLKKGKSIQKARLPKKFSAKKKEFKRLSALLVEQLTDLDQMKDKVDDEMLALKFNEMHETFETLASILH